MPIQNIIIIAFIFVVIMIFVPIIVRTVMNDKMENLAPSEFKSEDLNTIESVFLQANYDKENKYLECNLQNLIALIKVKETLT